MLQVLQISVGENTLKAGDGISFAGKEPVFTIKANEVTITAGEGIEVTGTYPNYNIERKKHFIGEHYGGGIVFYVDEDEQHGLIAGGFYKNSTWSTFPWEPYPKRDKITSKDFKTLNNRRSAIGSGEMNTIQMLTHDKFDNVVDQGEPTSISQFFIFYDIGDWFLPSLEELCLVYKQKKNLSTTLQLSDKYHILWSSTEGYPNEIWQGHGDGPDGQNLADGKYFEGYSKIPVKLGGKVTGAMCINFYTGKKVSIAKTYNKAFILIREF